MDDLLLAQERDSDIFKLNPGWEMGVIPFLECASQEEFVACDSEGTGLKVWEGGGDHGIGVSLSYRLLGTTTIASKYLPLFHTEGNLTGVERDAVFEWFDKRRDPLIFHNVKYDYLSFQSMGMKLQGIVYDTMVMAHMVDEYRKFMGLNKAVQYYLGRPGKHKSPLFEMYKAKFKPIYPESDGFCAEFPVAAMEGYAMGDTQETLLLFEELLSRMKIMELA